MCRFRFYVYVEDKVKTLNRKTGRIDMTNYFLYVYFVRFKICLVMTRYIFRVSGEVEFVVKVCDIYGER